MSIIIFLIEALYGICLVYDFRVNKTCMLCAKSEEELFLKLENILCKNGYESKVIDALKKDKKYQALYITQEDNYYMLHWRYK